MSKGNHRLLSLPRLRECRDDARGFALATGDRNIYNLLQAAVEAAERYEPDDVKKCVVCDRPTPGPKNNYCSLDCADTDGACCK